MDRSMRSTAGHLDDQEFATAALSHHGMLYALARRFVHSPLEAEDIVQETYLRALQSWRRRRPDQIRPWLATICVNVARSHYRQRQARPAEALHPNPGMSICSPLDTAEEAIARLTGRRVHVALKRLPSAQRTAVVLMDMCGFTAAAAAQLLGVPRGTILARVHRGRKRLAELLDGRETR